MTAFIAALKNCKTLRNKCDLDVEDGTCPKELDAPSQQEVVQQDGVLFPV